MIHLSKLTPAEILILTKNDVSQQEILKITFVDLLLKKVLRTFEVERQPHINQEIRIYKYIAIGQNFRYYKSLNHESIFLSPFVHDNSLEILFRNLVRIGYQNSKSLGALKNEILRSPNLNGCFSQNIFQKIFQSYSITQYGSDLKRKVEQEIQTLSDEFSAVNDLENQKAIELIKIIGANIFLLVNVDYDLLKQIDHLLGIEMAKNNSVDVDTGYSGCSSTFDDYSLSFDNGCSSDNGCGGNSGCSGCGGCGGD